MSLICPYSKLGCLSAILTKWDANPKINVLLGLLGIIISKNGIPIAQPVCSGIGFLTPVQDNCWLMRVRAHTIQVYHHLVWESRS